MAEIIADYRQHVEGERETVDWKRPDGHTYFNVPVCFLREVTPEAECFETLQPFETAPKPPAPPDAQGSLF